MRPFCGFVAVGAVGFVIQSGLVTTFMLDYGVHAVPAWGISFAVAVTATWLLNRTLVFRVTETARSATRLEYGRYVLVQVGGAILSLAIFTALLALFPYLEEIPVVAVAGGASFALFFNFAGARWWVFNVPEGR